MSFEDRYDALPERTQRMVDLLSVGMTNASIAEELGMTQGAVRQLMSRTFNILGADTRLQLAVLVIEMRKREKLSGGLAQLAEQRDPSLPELR